MQNRNLVFLAVMASLALLASGCTQEPAQPVFNVSHVVLPGSVSQASEAISYGNITSVITTTEFKNDSLAGEAVQRLVVGFNPMDLEIGGSDVKYLIGDENGREPTQIYFYKSGSSVVFINSTTDVGCLRDIKSCTSPESHSFVESYITGHPAW